MPTYLLYLWNLQVGHCLEAHPTVQGSTDQRKWCAGVPRSVQNSIEGIQNIVPGDSGSRHVSLHLIFRSRLLRRVTLRNYNCNHDVYLDWQSWTNARIPVESHNLQTAPQLLPTVTSFIPGLPTGDPFRISLHSWQNPDISRYIQTLKKPTDLVLFEARVFIDGRIAG